MVGEKESSERQRTIGVVLPLIMQVSEKASCGAGVQSPVAVG